MKKALTLVLALVLVLSLAACGNSNTPSNTPSSTPSGNNTTSNPPASNTPSETPSDGDSKLVNEWPKAIYDPYNIPAYTDGQIVCVDESPYSIPSANTFVEGSAVHIADASFATLVAYIKELKDAKVGDITDFDIESIEKKENGSGSVTFALADGKILQIGWWGYEPQKDFYYDDASNMVNYTHNAEFFIFE